jgi:diguanylate cyclase (GGDEF)-like protein
MFKHEGPARSVKKNATLAGYLAFVAGFVNSGGFVMSRSFTSHITGSVGRFSDDLATKQNDAALFAALLVLMFFVGAVAASLTIESAAFRQKAHAYGVALLMEGTILLAFILVAGFFHATHARALDLGAALLCFAMGMQNSLVTRLSGAVVRTTHLTGVVTDLGIEAARWLRWYRGHRRGIEALPRPQGKALLLLTIICAFTMGGISGAFLTLRASHWAMLFPAFAVFAASALAFADSTSTPRVWNVTCAVSSSRYRRAPKRYMYPCLGALVALGAPCGYFILRALLSGMLPLAPVWELELTRNSFTYAYLFISTTIAFMTVGYFVGNREDAVARDAYVDPLTGLGNRRSLHERLARELLHCSPRRPMALLLIDVDGLKRINDEHGHLAGDAALVAVAQGLRATSRGGDLPTRHGGDEFVLIAPSTDATQALTLATRMASNLAAVNVKGIARSPSVSIGVVCATQTTSEEEILAAADHALYAAKSAGRNRAVVGALTPTGGAAVAVRRTE